MAAGSATSHQACKIACILKRKFDIISQALLSFNYAPWINYSLCTFKANEQSFLIYVLILYVLSSLHVWKLVAVLY